MGGMLGMAALYLTAALIAVPLAARLGLGSVLGYLLAGVVIGPFGLELVGEESQEVLHFAELGVVMMMFLVGLELDPAKLWRLRVPVFGLGGLQVALTAVLVAACAVGLGLPWQQGVAVGLIAAMSSTAIALQSLQERGLMRSPGGQTAFSVLLFQDVAVIPILALFPLLATLEVHHGGDGHGPTTLVDGLPAWQRAIAVIAAVSAVIGAGRVLVGPLMRVVARAGSRELFTAAALLIVIGVAVLMGAVGLSAALGTFLAGVVLANSEYRHELVSDVEPFKGLLLGLFFMAVGANVDFGVLGTAPLEMAGLVLGLIAVKALALAVVARAGGLPAEPASLVAVSLAQVGEFAFVLLSFAEDNGVLPHDVTAPLVAATAFSMAATPFLMTFQARFLAPRLISVAVPQEKASNAEDESHPVIIAGYGRFGQIAGRLLRFQGIGVTVLDVDSEQVDMLLRFGQKAFYGDASRLDVLHAAGAHHAKVLIVAVDDPVKAEEITALAQRHFPHLAILARARGRSEAFELVARDVAGVYRETFESALHAGSDALRLLGLPGAVAQRAAVRFRQLDERLLVEMAGHRHDQDSAAYMTKARQGLADFEALMQREAAEAHGSGGHDWEGDVLREGVLAGERVAP